jgi:hypothetical protein
VAGAYYATKRSDKLGYAVAGAGGGWAAGWVAQKVILGLFDRLAYPQMPTEPAVPQNGGQAQMPAGSTEYQDPSAEYQAARAVADNGNGNMAGMPYGAQEGVYGSTPSAPSTHGQKGGGDGVVFHEVAAQSGQERNPQVRGTLFKDAYGGQMGI